MNIFNKKKIKKETGERENVVSWFSVIKRRPTRAWQVIFSSFLLVVVLLLSFSAYLSYRIYKGQIFIVEKSDDSSVVTIDRDRLSRAVSDYAERDLRSKSFGAGRVLFGDPAK